MNPDWKKLSEAIEDCNKLLGLFADGITDQRTNKAFARFFPAWKKVISLHNEYDQKLEPIAPVNVKYPFPGDDFARAWKVYKEYLLESHNYAMKSRSENASLSRLKKMSENNVNRAMEMLEFFMANQYKNIFKPSTRQLTGDEPVKVEDSTIDIDVTRKAERKI